MKLLKNLPLIAALLMAFATLAQSEETLVGPRTPLLLKTHRGGFVAPPFQNSACEIFGGGVILTRNGRVVHRKPRLTFTAEIPNLRRLEWNLRLARLGREFSTRGVVPDLGTSETHALFPQNVLLQRLTFPRGLRNSSPVTGALLRFTDVNCQ